MAKVVAEYEKFEVDNALLMEALKGGAMGAGVVFATDFLLSKFLHNGKIRAAICAVAPVALSMWLKDKSPEVAKGIAVGGAGAGIYKLMQAFLYEKLHIPYSGEYGIIEEVPAEEMPMVQEYGVIEEVPAEEMPVVQEATPGYGIIEEVPVEQPEEIVEQPAYGTSLA